MGRLGKKIIYVIICVIFTQKYVYISYICIFTHLYVYMSMYGCIYLFIYLTSGLQLLLGLFGSFINIHIFSKKNFKKVLFLWVDLPWSQRIGLGQRSRSNPQPWLVSHPSGTTGTTKYDSHAENNLQKVLFNIVWSGKDSSTR